MWDSFQHRLRTDAETTKKKKTQNKNVIFGSNIFFWFFLSLFLSKRKLRRNPESSLCNTIWRVVTCVRCRAVDVIGRMLQSMSILYMLMIQLLRISSFYLYVCVSVDVETIDRIYSLPLTQHTNRTFFVFFFFTFIVQFMVDLTCEIKKTTLVYMQIRQSKAFTSISSYGHIEQYMCSTYLDNRR